MKLCKVCGKIYENKEECCGEPTISVNDALETQGQLFEATEDDRARSVFSLLRSNFLAAVEAEKKAKTKLDDREQAKQRAGTILLDVWFMQDHAAKDSLIAEASTYLEGDGDDAA
jgi:hypothetical protein